MPTRAQLRTSTRIEADQDNSTFPTDAALNEIIDRATRTVWRRMLAVGWKPDRTTVNITATGASSYTVGSDVSVVHSVMFLSGSGTTAFRIPVTRIKPEEIDALIPLGGNQAMRYDLIGGGTAALTIEFYPNPSSGLYEVRYTKRFPGFTADGDTWIGPDGSDELIILTAAIEAVNKEGDPADMNKALESRLTARWSEVIEAAGWTDSLGQQTIRDTNRTINWRPGDYNVREGWE